MCVCVYVCVRVYVCVCVRVCMRVCVLPHGPFFRSWVTRSEARLGYVKLAKGHVEIFVTRTETYLSLIHI